MNPVKDVHALLTERGPEFILYMKWSGTMSTCRQGNRLALLGHEKVKVS